MVMEALALLHQCVLVLRDGVETLVDKVLPNFNNLTH